MSETKYCRLVTVDTGDGLRVAHAESGISVYEGDMVSIDTNETGIAIAVLFMQEGGEEYSFIANLNPIYKVTAVYHHSWSREEEANESA